MKQPTKEYTHSMNTPNERGISAKSLPFRFLTWRKPRSVGDLLVWTPFLNPHEAELALSRLNEALALLKEYTPTRHARVMRHVRGFIIGAPGADGSYDKEHKVCQLAGLYTLAPTTTASAIAATIVHEATHGLLFSRGIDYSEPIRYRVEMICVKASLFVAQRLPNAADVVDLCRRQQKNEPHAFTNAGLDARTVQQLRELGCPEWIIRTIFWLRPKPAGH